MRPLQACLGQAERGARAPQARGSARRFLEHRVREEGGLPPGEKRPPRRPCAGPDACHKPTCKGRRGRPTSTRRSPENSSTSVSKPSRQAARGWRSPSLGQGTAPLGVAGTGRGQGLAGAIRGWGDASGIGGRWATRAVCKGERASAGGTGRGVGGGGPGTAPVGLHDEAAWWGMPTGGDTAGGRSLPGTGSGAVAGGGNLSGARVETRGTDEDPLPDVSSPLGPLGSAMAAPGPRKTLRLTLNGATGGSADS